jgi:hypothetical protein
MKDLDAFLEYYDSPLGMLKITANNTGLTAIVLLMKLYNSLLKQMLSPI